MCVIICVPIVLEPGEDFWGIFGAEDEMPLCVIRLAVYT